MTFELKHHTQTGRGKKMQTTMEAVYEHGVLRPLQALPLAEGSRVEVIVTLTEPTRENRTPAENIQAMLQSYYKYIYLTNKFEVFHHL